MTWISGSGRKSHRLLWSPEKDGQRPEPTPYMAEQLEDLEPLRDESGDVPYPADG